MTELNVSFWMATGMKLAGEEDQLRNLQAGEMQVVVTTGSGMTAVGRGMSAVIWERGEMTETEEDLLSDQSVRKVEMFFLYDRWTLESHNIWANLGFCYVLNLYEHQKQDGHVDLLFHLELKVLTNLLTGCFVKFSSSLNLKYSSRLIQWCSKQYLYWFYKKSLFYVKKERSKVLVDKHKV